MQSLYGDEDDGSVSKAAVLEDLSIKGHTVHCITSKGRAVHCIQFIALAVPLKYMYSLNGK